MSQEETRPLRSCDIVMKGGITSGVVYPSAITKLAERFIFKNIGGTSAGAIAAAGAAAAEFRRAKDGTSAGFQKLAALPDFLGEKPGGGARTRLFHFFQPNARTRSIFNVLVQTIGSSRKPLTFVLCAITQYPLWAAIGTLPGLLLAMLPLTHFVVNSLVVWLSLVLSVLILLIGAIAATSSRLVVEAFVEIPRNNYGLCSGLSEGATSFTTPGQPEALTVWLTRYLNEIANVPADRPPLTFGDLWDTRESDQDKAVRGINLEMMTSNLTHGRPCRLPFRDDADLRENFYYFREDEFRQLFPSHIVQWMIDHPRGSAELASNSARAERRERLKKKGYYPFPAPADLPVVVATRMSLSFPILLSAVPLHAIDRSLSMDNEQPERCWFSDGGMCSNFPLHFFDAPLPRRPTFSIDLTQKPNDARPEQLRPEMPDTNSAEIFDRWNRFDTEIPKQPNQPPVELPAGQRLLGFFHAMIATMQNWTDATQGRLPGFRDRIVSVPLTSKEGGLNLDMPSERIKELSERGIIAAQLLEAHFDVPSRHRLMTWDNHRWIRLRSFLASLERSLNQLVSACENPENGDRSFEQWLADLENAGAVDETIDNEKAPSYSMNHRQLAAARQTLEELQKIHELWKASPAAGKAPRPRPVLRPRPQV